MIMKKIPVSMLMLILIPILMSSCAAQPQQSEQQSQQQQSIASSQTDTNTSAAQSSAADGGSSESKVGDLIDAINHLDNQKLKETDRFECGNGFPDYIKKYSRTCGKDRQITYSVVSKEEHQAGDEYTTRISEYLDGRNVSEFDVYTLNVSISGSKGKKKERMYVSTAEIDNQWWVMEYGQEKEDVYLKSYSDDE